MNQGKPIAKPKVVDGKPGIEIEVGWITVEMVLFDAALRFAEQLEYEVSKGRATGLADASIECEIKGDVLEIHPEGATQLVEHIRAQARKWSG